MASSLPKLRRDLDCRRLTAANRTVFVIKDPLTGEYYRFKEAEQFILSKLDGQTTAAEVLDSAETRFGTKLAPRMLDDFIHNLERNGLVESERGKRELRRRQNKYEESRVAGSTLYVRYKLVNPDKLLDRLIGPLGFFFTRTFVWLSAATILFAAAIAFLNWGAIIGDIGRLISLSTIPLLILTIFFSLSAHEFAHGLTCKHFGGKVPEMGFMLLYFQPAMYCNVSDAWLFPEKYKRLWVGFAGPYFELFLGALAVILWRVTATDTWLNQASLVLLATTGIKTLFNFNPLIKLDGYYLLSDYLDIPNLRQKSFTYVGHRIKRLFGAAQRPPDLTRRERKIYLYYGVTASIFSFFLIAYIRFGIGEFLIVQDQRALFIAFAGLIGMRLRDKLRSLFGRGYERPGSDEGGSGKSHTERAAGERTANGSGGGSASRSNRTTRSESDRDRRRAVRKWRNRIIKGAVAATAALVVLFGEMELHVSGPITVLPEHNADVRTNIEGTLASIHVEEGQFVSRGDLIARLSDRDLREKLEITEADIRKIQARLDLLRAGPTVQEIDVAESEVETARDRLRFAQSKRERTETLLKQSLISRSEHDAALELETNARNELDAARKRLEVLLHGSRPEEIAATQAELARLETGKKYLLKDLEDVNVRSPAAGVVTTPNRVLREKLRTVVPKGGLIAKVYELEVITVEAIISEKEIADVVVGQRVGVKARAYPDRVFYGTVMEIGTTTTKSAASGDSAGQPDSDSGMGSGPAATSIRVVTQIDNSKGLLKPGMTGMAKIYCGERRIIDLVIRRLSRTFRVEFWSWW